MSHFPVLCLIYVYKMVMLTSPQSTQWSRKVESFSISSSKIVFLLNYVNLSAVFQRNPQKRKEQVKRAGICFWLFLHFNHFLLYFEVDLYFLFLTLKAIGELSMIITTLSSPDLRSNLDGRIMVLKAAGDGIARGWRCWRVRLQFCPECWWWQMAETGEDNLGQISPV